MDYISTKLPKATSASRPDLREKDEERRIIFWDGISTFFKVTGMVVWFLIMLLTMLEIKRYFHLDLFPGYDSAIDTLYNGVRSNFGKDL